MVDCPFCVIGCNDSEECKERVRNNRPALCEGPGFTFSRTDNRTVTAKEYSDMMGIDYYKVRSMAVRGKLNAVMAYKDADRDGRGFFQLSIVV